MTHNDLLRSVRYMLDIHDGKVASIFRLGGCDLAVPDVSDLLKKEDEAGYRACSDVQMAYFLAGLVIYRRGKDDSRPAAAVEMPLTNNIVLKKLRVAFELKDDDIQAILQSVGFTVSTSELSALFRKVGHKHFRACGDQLLRNFLKGLTLRLRG